MLRRLLTALVLLIQPLIVFSVSQPVHAAQGGLLVYQLQTGTTSSATEELVSFINTSSQPVDVTGWCITKTSSTDTGGAAQIGCISSKNVQILMMLPPGGVVSFATDQFVQAHSGYYPDAIFAANIAATAGHIRLVDVSKQEVDRLGWGTAVHPETLATPAHANGKMLQRTSLNGVIQDTDNNNLDFTQVPPTSLPTRSLYEQVVELDVCPNIEGHQPEMPDGLLPDSEGLCQQDECLNLDQLQTAVPEGYVIEGSYICSLIPLEGAPLIISELLANATSYDAGKEFVEIYNPTDRPVSLKGYVLQVAPSFDTPYPLPEDVELPAHGYVSFSDTQTGLVLPNTSASVRLVAPNGEVTSTTDPYASPGEDVSWVLIDGSWQYSNQPTPSAANATSVEVVPASADSSDTNGETSTLSPCAANQYRNPETNRCRLLQTTSAALVTCKEGQVRNPETNRCRSVLAALTSLVACKEGQERNQETNRCKAISTSSLTPCGVGQERNPETNRCRKVGTVAGASTKVQDVVAPSSSGSSIRWWLAAIALAAAGTYAIYEWRQDIANFFHRRRLRRTEH